MKKLLAIIMTFALLFSCTAVYAADTSGSLPMTPQTSSSYFTIETLPTSLREYIQGVEVPINKSTIFWVDEAEDSTSTLRIQNSTGSQIEITSIFSISTDENGNAYRNNAVAELLNPSVIPDSPQSGSSQFIQKGIKINYTCVYDYQIANKSYYHMIGCYFTYLTDAGTAPSSVKIEFSGIGDLYIRNGNTYTKKQTNYYKSIIFTKYAPSKNIMYSKTDEMPANQYIDPNNVYDGINAVIYVTVGGEVLRDGVMFS